MFRTNKFIIRRLFLYTQHTAYSTLNIVRCVYRNNYNNNNTIIKQKINVTRCLLDDIKTKQLQSYGHVQRMEEGGFPKEVMKWRPPGRRKWGRPKLTWAEWIRGLMGEKV